MITGVGGCAAPWGGEGVVPCGPQAAHVQKGHVTLVNLEKNMEEPGQWSPWGTNNGPWGRTQRKCDLTIEADLLEKASKQQNTKKMHH